MEDFKYLTRHQKKKLNIPNSLLCTGLVFDENDNIIVKNKKEENITKKQTSNTNQTQNENNVITTNQKIFKAIRDNMNEISTKNKSKK